MALIILKEAKKEASMEDIEALISTDTNPDNPESLYHTEDPERYVLAYRQLKNKDVIGLFRNIEDEVKFTQYLDSKSRIMDDEEPIMLAFLQSRTPSQLDALYEKQTLKSWQINLAIQHGVALRSLYSHNVLSTASIDLAIQKGIDLIYLYKYQPNFTKKHLARIKEYLEKVHGQSVDVDTMTVYTRNDPVPEFAHPRTKNRQIVQRFLLKKSVNESIVRNTVRKAMREVF